MKKLIQNFKDSLKNASFYKNKASEEHSTGYSYLAKLALFAGVVIYLIMVLGLYFSGALTKVKNEVNEKITADLSVYIDKNGELSINQPTPYIILMPESFKDDADSKNDEEVLRTNFVVIDPSRDADATVFDAYDTMIFVSKDRLMMERSNGEIRSFPLKNWSETTINKQIINGLILKMYNFAWIVMMIAVIPFWFIFFFTYILTAFFASIILYFLLKKFYKPISFKQTMNTAMYGYTYAFLLGIVFSIINTSPVSGYFWTKVLITILAVVYFLSKKEDIAQDEVANPTTSAPIASDNTNVV